MCRASGCEIGTSCRQQAPQPFRQLIFRPDASAGLHRLKIDGNNRRVHFFYRTAYYQPSAHDDDLVAGQ